MIDFLYQQPVKDYKNKEVVVAVLKGGCPRSKDGLAMSIAFLIYATVFGIFMLITSSINLIKYYVSKNSKLINVNI